MSVATISKMILVSVALSMGMAATAQAELKVAVINFQRLGDESPQSKATFQLLQTEFAPRQRELQQKEKDLQTKQEKLQRDGAVMSEAERSNLEKDIAKNQRDLKSQGEAFSDEVNSRKNEELGKLQTQLVAEVQNFAKNNNYDLVLSASVALFAKDSFDITSQVLTYLQARGDTKPAAPAATKPAK